MLFYPSVQKSETRQFASNNRRSGPDSNSKRTKCKEKTKAKQAKTILCRSVARHSKSFDISRYRKRFDESSAASQALKNKPSKVIIMSINED